ncbi:MAG: aldolase/citrate lyase family protein [Actinomycetota bacterium]|nr:aldolase/citrate lyase family protein [Actinomycetota bacterium]
MTRPGPSPPASLPGDVLAALDARLRHADEELARRYPGDPGGRQPVHTVYVPADRFTADCARQHGEEARRCLREHGPDPGAFAAAVGLPAALAPQVYPLVVDKLHREPVEDVRIDFEDGYGAPGDAEEDRCAQTAAERAGRALARGELPPFVGVRVKPLEHAARPRGIRTLDVFVTGLLAATDGRLPPGFSVTLPKVTSPAQVTVFVELLERLEGALGLPAGALRFEIQVETTQAVLDHRGTVMLPRLVEAARGRCTGVHFGTYDYTAACGLAPAQQHLAHPACDFARHVMQVATAGTGVRLSDGSTNVLPVPPDVHGGWRLHYNLVRRGLEHGFYQGWDLHPAQLPTRYAAVYAFYRQDLDWVGARLRALAPGGRTVGAVMDEPATARALAGHVLRAVDCGAVDADEAESRTGLGAEDLRRLARRSPPMTP